MKEVFVGLIVNWIAEKNVCNSLHKSDLLLRLIADFGMQKYLSPFSVELNFS